MHFTAEFFHCRTKIFLQSLNDLFEFFVHNHYCSRCDPELISLPDL